MRLYVVSRYSNGVVAYQPGQVLDLTEEQAAHLLADSPGSFRKSKPKEEARAMPEVAVDRQMRGGKTR